MSVAIGTDTARPMGDGVTFTRLQPGGLAGPHGEVLRDVPGGVHWRDLWRIGEDSDEFKMAIPDIRMPPNQYWPMHWHDEWIAVLVLDGTCLIGDWWMQRGDVLVSRENFEYGPVVNGPRGCQMIEVFARDSWGGGYGAEYHDHPTLTNNIENRVVVAGSEPMPVRSGLNFGDRPPGSEGNGRNQTLTVTGVPELTTGQLRGGQRWELGEPDDPDRGVMLDTRLEHGQRIPAHRHADARWLLVMDGSMQVGDRELERDDIVIVRRDAVVDELEPGPRGVHFVEFVRTAAGVALICDDGCRTDPAYAHMSTTLPEVEFRSG
jgi:quercetin dioxygenase-like cupin family protein